MTIDGFNDFCSDLPVTTYIMQWRGSHVWKVGGKVFAIGVITDGEPAFTFKTDSVGFDLLAQMPGVRPAPYFASRGMKWVQHHGAPGLSDPLLKDQLEAAHRIVAAGLTKRLQTELGLR